MKTKTHIQNISAIALCWLLVSGCEALFALPVLHDDRWDSVVLTRIEPADNWVYEAGFEPRFYGKYRVGLTIDPWENFPVDEFALEGAFRVLGKNGELLIHRDFSVLVNQFSSFELCRIELSRKMVKDSDRFELRIDAGGTQLNEESSEVTFYVNRYATIGLTY